MTFRQLTILLSVNNLNAMINAGGRRAQHLNMLTDGLMKIWKAEGFDIVSMSYVNTMGLLSHDH